MKLIGMDVGSTTVKAVVVEDGRVTWQSTMRLGSGVTCLGWPSLGAG